MSKQNFFAWIKAAGIRAVRTVAQTAVATISTAAVLSDVNWIMVASTSVLSGILSVLMSLGGLPELNGGDDGGDDFGGTNAKG